jgi:hypothetical protein
MRLKINKGLTTIQKSSDFPSDLYKKFRKIFSILSSSDNPSNKSSDFSRWYVNNKNLEEEIFSILEEAHDCTKILIGNTGIGKSTLIRYCFQTDKIAIFQDHKCLFIPFHFNPQRIKDTADCHQKFIAKISASSSMIIENFNLKINEKDIAEFIKVNRRDLLELTALPEGSSNEQKVCQLREKDRFSYEMEKLKLLLAMTSNIDRVLILVDDIEALGYTLEKQVIKDVLSTKECLLNNDAIEYTTLVLISCRPTTYEMLKKEPGLDVYCEDEIQFNKPVSLADLFKARFDSAITSDYMTKIKNKQEWDQAYKVLIYLTSRIGNNFGYILINLCNHNIRDAFKKFRGILRNRRFFQKNKYPKAEFKIDELDYAANDAAVIRALAMPYGEIYFDNQESPISNLFYNTEEPASDLLVTFVIRYLLERNRLIGASEYNNPFNIAQLLDKVEIIFEAEQIKKKFEATIEYMFSRHLLFNPVDFNADLVIITPKAIQLWNLLGMTSLLLDCYREDVYREFIDNRPNITNLTWRLSNDQIFLDSFNFAEEIIIIEKNYLNFALLNSNIPLMKELFGGELLSRKIFLGISNSCITFYRDPKRIPFNLKSRNQNLITEIQTLENIYS